MPQTPPPLSEILAGYGARLALVREALGRSQRAMAAEMGVSASRWNHWEKERFPPDIHVMAMLRRMHQVPLDWIYAADWRLLPLHIAQWIMTRGAAADAPQAAKNLRLAFGNDTGLVPQGRGLAHAADEQAPPPTAGVGPRQPPRGLRRAGPRSLLHEEQSKLSD